MQIRASLYPGKFNPKINLAHSTWDAPCCVKGLGVLPEL